MNLQNARNLQSDLFKIIDILKEIESTSSRKEKEKILKLNNSNILFERVLEYIYNPYKVYGVGKKTLEGVDELPIIMVQPKFKSIFHVLDYLSEVNLNNDIKSDIIEFLSASPKPLRELYVKMILKDLRIGATIKTINSVFKGLIPEFNLMQGKKYEDYAEKIKGETIIITTKLNGNRLIAIKENKDIKLMTRQGNILYGYVDIEKEIQLLPDGVYDGEVQKINPEGLSSKMLYQETKKITGRKGVKKDLIFHVFDYLSVDEFKSGISKDNCLERKNKLSKILSGFELKWIKKVEILCITDDHSKIKEYLEEAVVNEEEGLMVNLAHAKYECKRSKNILKVKQFHTFDGRITGVYEGDGKYKGKLGGITITFKDIEVKCGSGFSDSERELYWSNPKAIIGKIGTCNYKEETVDQYGKKDLQFCTWNELRLDKDEVSYN